MITMTEIQTMTDEEVAQLNAELRKKFARRIAFRILTAVVVHVVGSLIVRSIENSQK